MKEFTFKTRYDLGEKVVGFDYTNNKLVEFEIDKITFDIFQSGISIWYHGGRYLFRENNVYRTKEEFINSL